MIRSDTGPTLMLYFALARSAAVLPQVKLWCILPVFSLERLYLALTGVA